MNRAMTLASLLAAGLLMAGTSFAQAPAGAPAGSTGACKDGSYSTQATKKGACRGHKGVKEWYAADAEPTAKAAKPSKAASAPAAASVAATGAAPSGSTGQCKDGSYTDTATKKGACRGHKGVKEWYAADAAAAAPAARAAASAPAAPMAAAPMAPAAPAAAPAASTRRPTQFTPPAEAAAGGGAGMVWANGSSKVYHCPGDKWYGKTKSGSYMSEADAKAKGLHADHGKACTN